MLDYFGKKLNELLETLIDPAWRRILGLGWLGRLAVAVTLGVVFAVATHYKAVLQYGSQAVDALHVWRAGPNHIPFEPALTDGLDLALRRARGKLATDLDSLLGHPVQPWATAQTLMALTYRTAQAQHIDPRRTIDTVTDTSCACLRERTDGDFPPNVPATGWGFVALASSATAVTGRELQFLLRNQRTDGSWPYFPAVLDSYGSVYATAWAMWGLSEQLRVLQPSAGGADSIRSAVNRAKVWLLSARVPGQARWPDYPLLAKRPELLSHSGLVMHVLHAAGEASMADLDGQWIASLPASSPRADVCEQSKIALRTPDRDLLDYYCYLVVPWTLIATVDVYQHGTLAQRVRILRWLRETVAQSDLMNADASGPDWQRAEQVLALQYLRSATAP